MAIENQSLRTLSVRRDARIRQIATTKPFIAGSLAKVRVKCGNPSCKCASGERHEAWVLTRKERGKTVTVHVPRDMVEEVAAWVKTHRQLKKLIKETSELGEQMIRIFVKASRGAARSRERVSRQQASASCEPKSTTSPISTIIAEPSQTHAPVRKRAPSR